MPDLTSSNLLLAGGIGALAGLLGGLAGIGGSVVIIPCLGLLLGYHYADKSEQHLYMAAAMCLNVVVAIPATYRHWKAGFVRRRLVRGLLPAMMAGIVLGAILSNATPVRALKIGLAIAIACDAAWSIYRVLAKHREPTEPDGRATWPRLAAIGGFTGIASGLIAIGGGILTVPLLQFICRVPLRYAIAASSAVMCITAAAGAATKVSTLHEHGISVWDALVLVGVMAPPAIVMSLVGARLSHVLPIPILRIVISLALLAAAARLAGLI